MLWKSCSVQQTATPIHTWCISHTWQQPLLAPTLCLLLSLLSHRQTHEHKYTNLLRPSNTSDPEPRLTAKAGWMMNQWKDQRRARDRWAKESTARWCLFIAKTSKSLVWQEACRKRSEWSFNQMIMLVGFFCFFFENENNIRSILCYLWSWLAHQLRVPTSFHTENL